MGIPSMVNAMDNKCIYFTVLCYLRCCVFHSISFRFIGCGSFLCFTYFHSLSQLKEQKRISRICIFVDCGIWKRDKAWREGESETKSFLVTKICFSSQRTYFFSSIFWYTQREKELSLDGISDASMAMTKITTTTIATNTQAVCNKVIRSTSYSQQTTNSPAKLMLIEVHFIRFSLDRMEFSLSLPLLLSPTLILSFNNKSLSIHILASSTNVRCIHTTIQSYI